MTVRNVLFVRELFETSMLTYTEAQLLTMGIKLHNLSQIIIQEKTFRLVFSFSKKMQDFVNDFCQRQKMKGNNCIVIEMSTTICVWRQIVPIEQDISGDLEPVEDKTGELIRQKFPEETKFLSASLITQCTTILTEYIGPIALLIVNDLSSKNPNCQPADFVEALTSCISDPLVAKEFRRRILTIL